MTESIPEQIHRASKKTRYIEIFFHRGKSIKLDGSDLTDLLCHMEMDQVIDFQISHRYDGTTPISADQEDYGVLVRQLWSIIDSKTDTSANKIKRIRQMVTDFEKQHEPEIETLNTLDTVDK